MKTIISATYKVRSSTGSSIEMVLHDLDHEVHLMICWALQHPEAARCLLPRWHRLRDDMQAIADHAEGSAKNHGIQP